MNQDNPRTLPKYPIVDSHCHLDYPPLNQNYADILKRAEKAHIGAIITIATKPDRFQSTLDLIKNDPHIGCALGVHPHHAGDNPDIKPETLIAYAENARTVAIGETGLDYYYNHSPKQIQEKLFRIHIEAAKETQLPLVIHSRNAEKDTIRILQDEMKKSTFIPLMHCFSSHDSLAEAAIEMGAYISFSGILTFPKAEAIRHTAQWIPHDRILVETDAPYLAPVPVRGKTNEPAFVVHTLNHLAQLRNQDNTEMARVTSDNFFRLFDKMPKPAIFNQPHDA